MTSISPNFGKRGFSDLIVEIALVGFSICVLLLMITIFIVLPVIFVFDVRPSDLGIVATLNDSGETPPPIAEEVFLNANEVAYCVNEKVRLTYLRDHGAKPGTIGFLAQAVDDFNLRCRLYYADAADLQIAHDNAALFAKRLHAQAEMILDEWSARGYRND